MAEELKGSENYTYNTSQQEYVVKIKSKKFPWWIFLLLLPLLLLFIPIPEKIDYTVVTKTDNAPAENAKVDLWYIIKETDEKHRITTQSTTEGKAEFKITTYFLFEIIIGKRSSDRNEIYNSMASKEGFLPDSITNKTLNFLKETDKNRILYLSTVQKVEIPDTAKNKPREGCRAFFTGLVVGGTYDYNNISEVYKVDDFSEYVGQGEYADNEKAFPKAVATTFDGIAIDKGTRVIIYSKKNFEGEILLDITGPAIINNVIWKDDDRYAHCNTDTYEEPLQSNFPQNVRQWSKTDMQKWSYGSLKVICEN